MTKNNPFTLENQFLVSTPSLNDPNFKKSVVLICKHNKEGAMGVVINRHTAQNTADIFDQLNIEISDNKNAANPVFEGGPVQPELGLIIHNCNSKSWESTMEIGEDIKLTSSIDILKDLAVGEGPDSFLMILGYSGWGPGQLENEIKENAWFTVPVDKRILFDSRIDRKWQRSAQILGIDANQFSSQVGHA